MQRFVGAAIAAALLLTSCSARDEATSTSDNGTIEGASATVGTVDPIDSFCERWDVFAEFSDQDQEPTEELVAELLRLQATVDEVVPVALDSDWQALDDWFQAFVDVLERDGYGPITEDTFIAAFGDTESADVASNRTDAAYQAIYDWQDANCPISERDQAFCEQWPPYGQLVNSDAEVDEQLVVDLRAMEGSLQEVVPAPLEGDLAASVDWNARFVDWHERNDYRELNDEDFLDVFDGDNALAEAVLEAREAAFPNIEAWIETNCGDPPEPSTALPVRFCSAWDEFVALTADDAELDEAQWERLGELVDVATAEVPAEIGDDWAAISNFIDRYSDVLVSVEFRREHITEEMLEQAFGSVEAYDEAVAARATAGGAIAEWSLEGCGDFCARWSDTREALDHFSYDLGWVGDSGDEGQRRVDEMEGRLVVAGQIVDAEIRADWNALTAAIGDWVGLWSSVDFDRQRLETATADGRLRALIAESSYLDGIVEMMRDFHLGDQERLPWDQAREWLAGRREPPDWLSERVGDPDQWFSEAILRNGPREWLQGSDLRIQEWVDANCAASTGGPGRLKVRYPRVEGRAGGMVLLALVPLGGSYDDLADVPGTIAAQCEPVSRDPWGVWIDQHEDENGDPIVEEGRHESDFFRDERWSEDHVCGFDHEAAPPLIDAGRHTLVGGIMWGSPGDPAEGIDLVSCVELDIEIDADTIVDLPPFEPCDVRIGGGEPDPWRHPTPVDPSTPGSGTLKVLVPEFVMPPWIGSRDGGELMVVALPAGATLNEVGRQQLWPAAAAATWLQPAGSEHARELARQGSALLPLAALPPSGRPVHLEPDWLVEDPPEDTLRLTLLAPGSYNVHFELVWQVDEREEVPSVAKVRWGQASLCAQSEVIIDGDTVIDMPELGECP